MCLQVANVRFEAAKTMQAIIKVADASVVKGQIVRDPPTLLCSAFSPSHSMPPSGSMSTSGCGWQVPLLTKMSSDADKDVQFYSGQALKAS